MKKILIFPVLALVFMAMPLTTKADFDPTCLIDPFGLFACDREPDVVNTTINNTNSNNVNSNINSPGANVVTGPIVNPNPVVVVTTPNYNYDNDYNNTYPLGANCYPTTTWAEVGETVIWRASVSGGNQNYHVTWSGTNGLDGNGTSISKRYNSEGTKNASIVVRSGNQTISRNCGSLEVNDDRNYDYNYNYDYDNDYYDNRSLSVSCSVNTSFAPVGTRVTWRAYASGGNGSYRYTWYGTDDLRGTSREIETSYNAPGTKTAYVVVKSGSRTITEYCSNSVTVGVPTYTNPAPTYTPPTTVIRYVEKPVEKPVEVAAGATLASLFSLENVPWGWVAVLVIIVLLFIIIYMVINNKKI